MNQGQNWATEYHAPVLVREVLALLRGRRRVLDCTLGGGGHALALLTEGGVERVVGVDRDPAAIAQASARLAEFAASGRFVAHLGNYEDAADVLDPADVCDGVLLDLGVSSHQFDAEERGFTFRPGAPLDMRMGPDGADTAADWLNHSSARELEAAFRSNADEPRAGRLAREIERRRERQAFATSDDLVNAIRGALGPRTGPGDFARLFQAVRIVVNQELTGLERAMPVLRDRLASAGRIVVISYHSGEDRIAKRAFQHWSARCICPPHQLTCTCRGAPLGKTLTKHTVIADAREQAENPRARSARLRAWEKAGD